jgi:hypothetical protein
MIQNFPQRTLLLCLVVCSYISKPTHADVRIWEEELTIPTYEVLEPDPVPRFYEGRVFRSAGTHFPFPISNGCPVSKRQNFTTPFIWITIYNKAVYCL